MAEAATAGPPSSPPLLWVPYPAPRSLLLLSLPRSPGPSYDPKDPIPRRGQFACPPGEDPRPQIDPIGPLDPSQAPLSFSPLSDPHRARKGDRLVSAGGADGSALPLSPSLH